MNVLFVIYIFSLFLVLVSNTLFKRLSKKNFLFLTIIEAIIFSLIFAFTYNIVYVPYESLIVKSNLDEKNLTGFINRILGKNNEPKEYNVNNKIISVSPENEHMIKKYINKNNWIIGPLEHKTKHDTINNDDLYCAANYGSEYTCCDQPNAKVPKKYICNKDKPHCIGYLHKEKWGFCAKDKINEIL
jgi:hypothetical protein